MSAKTDVNALANKHFLVEELFVGAFDLLKLHQFNPQAFPFLLESVAQSKNFSQQEDLDSENRFDILFAYPQETLELTEVAGGERFVETCRQIFAELSIPSSGVDLPFTGGWFAYFSYDYAEVVEPSLTLPKQKYDNALPLATIVRIPSAFIYDRQQQQLLAITESGFESHIEAMKQAFVSCQHQPLTLKSFEVLSESEEPEAKYLEGIDKIKEYILSGDVFQVNLSREWQVSLSTDDTVSVYAALREQNPAPFSALVDFADWQVISSSPELLVRYRSPWVETRPIAGTRKRGDDLDKDIALIKELRHHPKEIAEHVMLIDLERNDLGRICQAGSVEVNELMAIESYEHVHHIVSNIRGMLNKNVSPLEVVHATFPGGTITGCPKVRCMEIIAELEAMPRLAYTGSLGYINRDGSLDLNILIRTMLKQGPEIRFRAGAGIVADSIAEKELMEARQKAKGLVKALQSGTDLGAGS